MTGLFDATNWLAYFEDSMDTRRTLWFVRDVLDVDALRDNAVALAVGAGFQDFKSANHFCPHFLPCSWLWRMQI